jgi:chromosome segregation ATPase
MSDWDNLVEPARAALEALIRKGDAAADRIEELEAENKRLNEQMDAIEEMGTESLNALPDCLMRLAPALVENDELKAKLAKAVAGLNQCQDDIDGYIRQEYPQDHSLHERYRMRDFSANPARVTLAELKGQE